MKKMIIGTLISMLAGPFSVGAQEAQMTRLSKITVNADHLPAYRDALAEEVRASMELEPGDVPPRLSSEAVWSPILNE
ncbi:hypothetical protein ORG27_19190, partial [Stenotrophomonas lactitubi]|nr:hypothetical protein [Stenotrophomonas lactitubi]